MLQIGYHNTHTHTHTTPYRTVPCHTVPCHVAGLAPRTLQSAAYSLQPIQPSVESTQRRLTHRDRGASAAAGKLASSEVPLCRDRVRSANAPHAPYPISNNSVIQLGVRLPPHSPRAIMIALIAVEGRGEGRKLGEHGSTAMHASRRPASWSSLFCVTLRMRTEYLGNTYPAQHGTGAMVHRAGAGMARAPEPASTTAAVLSAPARAEEERERSPPLGALGMWSPSHIAAWAGDARGRWARQDGRAAGRTLFQQPAYTTAPYTVLSARGSPSLQSNSSHQPAEPERSRCGAPDSSQTREERRAGRFTAKHGGPVWSLLQSPREGWPADHRRRLSRVFLACSSAHYLLACSGTRALAAATYTACAAALALHHRMCGSAALTSWERGDRRAVDRSYVNRLSPLPPAHPKALPS